MTNYKSPISFGNGHIDTLFPFFFRATKKPKYERERFDLSDGDFLDIDWVKNSSDKLVIITHGMESCSYAKNILGMADIFSNQGLDVLAWNTRGSSGALNRAPHYYHGGLSGDLDEVVNYALAKDYKEIFFVGFSMGGNITLKYLAEKGEEVDSRLKAAALFSVPLHLGHVSECLSRGFSHIYTKHLLKTLKEKVKAKMKQFPELDIDINAVERVTTFAEFDELVTIKMFNFKSVDEYYFKNSSLNQLDKINLRTLVVNAKNDPFLAPSSFPSAELEKHKYIKFEVPATGGHCGFFEFTKDNILWSERRAVDFLVKENK